MKTQEKDNSTNGTASQAQAGNDYPVSLVLAGGGTAGHVNPLLSIAQAIRAQRPQAHISILGTSVGLEARLVPAAGFELTTIEKVPFPRSVNLDALKFPYRWIKERKAVSHLLSSSNADVVVGVGGYAAAPAYVAAHRAGLPLVIHEQNARAGMANKLGARWAQFVGTVYDDTGLPQQPESSDAQASSAAQAGQSTEASQGTQTSPASPASVHGVHRVGLPLRQAIAQACEEIETNPQAAREESARALGLDPHRPIVLVTGGSLGALSLNEAIAGACDALLEHAQVIHLTGKGKLAQVRETVTRIIGRQHLAGLGEDQAGQGDYHAAEYLEHIELAFLCADLVVCRSGAGTVSEIAALGIPAVYVPLPIGNGEQKFNAEPVVEAGGGMLVDDKDFTSQWVSKNLMELLADSARLQRMRQAAASWGVRNAAQVMASTILAIADEHYAQLHASANAAK
ncbi:UDP-N-acetylglucosamine--N-acetylmuramyl-(pentapeptide) pyrophosphoryl-undecaprenol N-acetylglucosamine transferase [Aeriscardovia aeriphila]|uniref:UDP-N-acetylglucosamine--N-acetylmuramyl-(pentapeptide) pyrophosphoryl-undecaprenol N-acetylglucosamine transferase n=1 Tax=Aeriscardovia aeriphila TaxID=218139 RepID=A0A261FAT9_9BIFI|nr:UDP-N-acetylglucosamine--N-acetylmuramyl-(pentapeptide) pyrophosphoryl-undecaprenol N-acetylglucosamine transferase [Aeriscardovia aeriphila]NYI25634.1 UDP-N-acetylglucosamine--N-acetylmuramyl-(pentapeptide) pyrophosphoryl-undecaprenol N-acetylglucosamine transferase [Aeriscardovia aeriphila]OZG56218.1 UDP-N-acetylglucosamine--N-acetylmuramyl- (pentap eptide) pyrophosphoryl-undecaprenol N-acetylglucosamine transferase [Aeriscardovia aeriphila]